MPLVEDLMPCTVCGEPVLWGTRHPVCGRRVMALDLAEMESIANPEEAKQRAAMWAEQDGTGVAHHCGNCADGVPGGPDNCSRCGREAPQYSHWTPAEIAALETLAAEQAQDMQRRAEDDAHALDPDDEPEFGTVPNRVRFTNVAPSDERVTPAHTCANAGTSAGACKTHCGDRVRCWGTQT